jgi:hypothetical protein
MRAIRDSLVWTVRSSSVVGGDVEVVEMGAECAHVHGMQGDEETDEASQDWQYRGEELAAEQRPFSLRGTSDSFPHHRPLPHFLPPQQGIVESLVVM